MKPECLRWTAMCALAALVGLSSLWLPAPLPASAPTGEFSAGRAMEIVRQIARAPHPEGSEENRRVRIFLMGKMEELGLKPRVIEGNARGAQVADLCGTLAGTQSTNADILLVAHYDSVPSGPGAADDAAGVSTVLETIRALKAKGPLRNSLMVLLTDGEEDQRGLPGSEMFARDHADLMKDVRLVMNLEARGNHGPVMMFETSDDNGGLIKLFSRACPLPVATSFSQDVYRRMPNDTDFTTFKRAGKRGLNFAFVGGLAYYHSRQVTPENLSLRTLQHFGDCVSSVAECAGRADEQALQELTEKGDATYFTLCRGLLVHYPAGLARALAYFSAGLFVLVAGKGILRKELRAKCFAASLGVSLLAVVLSVVAGVLVVFAILGIFKPPHFGPFITNLPFETGFLVLMLAIAAMISIGLKSRLLRRVSSTESLAGTVALWLVLALAANAMAPGASYLFMWATVFGTIALLISDDGNGGTFRGALLREALTVIPAAVLFAPTIVLIHQTITIGIAPVSMALVALAFCLKPVSSKPSVESNPAATP